jgi:hypothetical protein
MYPTVRTFPCISHPANFFRSAAARAPAKPDFAHLSLLRRKNHFFFRFLCFVRGKPFPFLQKFGKQHKAWLLNVESLPIVTS